MVETAVVTEVWPDVQTLRGLLSTYERTPLVEAVFVDNSGNWKLLAVMPDLDETGARPIYAAVDRAAAAQEVGFWLLERLVVLGSGDPEAFALTRALAHGDGPPRKLDLSLPSLPDYLGAVISRSDRLDRARTGRELEAALERFFESRGLVAQRDIRLDIGWRSDFSISFSNRAEVLVEAVVVDRRSIKTRLRDAAGLANVAGRPVILVLRALEGHPLGLEARYGVVPVFPVQWDDDNGPGDLDRALREAADVAAARDPGVHGETKWRSP